MQRGFDSRANLYSCLSLLIGLAVAVGCGRSDRVEVFGKVSLDGKPIADGDISFHPVQGTAATPSSTTIRNGEYRLTAEWGLAPGTYDVRINAYREPTDKSNMLPGGFLDKPPETPGIPRREQFLPPKFNTESTIEKLVVPSDKTQFEQNYDLKE